MKLIDSLRNSIRIKPEDEVPAEVARLYRHNFSINFIDNAIWMFGDSFVSVTTILPVFVSTLTSSPIIIGLIPAIINASWFLPQLFMANKLHRSKGLFPLARKMAILERIPHFFFPILALLIGRLPVNVILVFLILLILWRGISSGLTALPWQMLIATVIPMSHRSQYFGLSRVVGQLMGVIGSGIAAVVLERIVYPNNYAVTFLLGFFALSSSYIFFSRNKDPWVTSNPEDAQAAMTGGLGTYIIILKTDPNFRSYLLSRSTYFISVMASGFLAVYGIQKFGLNESQAAIFTGLLFASGVIGNAVWGVWGDRTGPKRILLLSSLIWVGMLLAAILAKSYWFYYLVFILLGLASAGFNVGDLVLVMELGNEKQQAAYVGLARGLPGIFLLIAPIFAGWLVGKTSYPFMFWLSIGFGLLSFLFMLRVKDRTR